MNSPSILHVEDDDASAFLFRLAVDQAGLSVSVYRVCDGDVALQFLQKRGAYQQARTPTLVLLDLNLPRVDGWAVLTAIRKDEALQQIPVVVMSTASTSYDQERALALGAQRYVVKPADFDVLVREVKLALADLLATE